MHHNLFLYMGFIILFVINHDIVDVISFYRIFLYILDDDIISYYYFYLYFNLYLYFSFAFVILYFLINN